MTQYRIRPARHDDAQMLAHIGVATFIESYTNDIDGNAMIAHCTREHAMGVYARYMENQMTAAWIAVQNKTGAPVGYALNCAPDLPVKPMRGDLELKRIYVLSKLHGRGLAADLLDAAIKHARTQNAPRLLLGTYEENHRAMAFYTKHGFETIGTRQFNVGGKIYDDIVMAKPL